MWFVGLFMWPLLGIINLYTEEWRWFLLCDIAANNSQVFYILQDGDVKRFYKELLHDYKKKNENASKIKSQIDYSK